MNVADPAAFAMQQVDNISRLNHHNWCVDWDVHNDGDDAYASSRLIYAVGRDGLLPGGLGRVEQAR